MQKKFKIEVDCANCAAKMERKIQAMSEIQAASITFATKQLRFAADDPESLVPQLEKACKTIEDEVTLVPKDNTPAPRVKKESVWSEHKADLISIIAGAALFAAGMIAEHAMSAGTSVILPIFLVGYLVLGWEVLLTAAKNIAGGAVFDENFLMAIATIGAFAIGEYPEAVAVMLFVINPVLALLTLIPVPFVLAASTLFSKKVAPMFQVNQRVLGRLNGVLQDKLSGMREIQAFAQEDAEHEKMARECSLYSRVNIRANFAAALYHPGVEFLTALGTVIVVGLGGWMASRGNMSVSDVVGFVMYLSLFYQPLAVLARLVEDVQTAYASAVRVFDVLDADSEVKEAPDARDLPACRGEVSFEKVSFRYNQEEPVLDRVSFTAHPGEMVAIVGPTGVGKTTVLSLLERFYDPQEGTVRLDGQDVLARHLLPQAVDDVPAGAAGPGRPPPPQE